MPDLPDPLRALHWNIHFWTDDTGHSNVDTVADLINNLTPEVVSLVEVEESGHTTAHLDEVARRTGLASVFVPAFEFGSGLGHGGFGNAILTRLPILAVRQHHLISPPPLYDGSEPSEPRTLLLTRVRRPSGPVWIGSTHLPRADTAARDKALRQLRAILAALPPPWLVLGDFNAAPASWLSDDATLASHPAPPAPTYPARAPDAPIDYCITPHDHHVHADVLAEPGSDHLPLLVRLDTCC
jgi:endonuclease/exonuclease/phosphatase family metal-dependent hydrolase